MNPISEGAKINITMEEKGGETAVVEKVAILHNIR